MMEQKLPKAYKEALSLLGLARRAGILVVGQDRMRRALRGRTSPFLLVFPGNVSKNVKCLFSGYEERGICKTYVLKGLDITDIAAVGGLPPAQVLGLPREHGLARRLESLLDEGVDAIE